MGGDLTQEVSRYFRRVLLFLCSTYMGGHSTQQIDQVGTRLWLDEVFNY